MSKTELTIPAKDRRLLTCPCGLLAACIPASFILTDRIATLTFVCGNEHRSTVTFEENRDTFVSITPDK
jgi:hypothetical protein